MRPVEQIVWTREERRPLLICSHVDVCYNGMPAVRDVSLTLHEGEIFGIAGESGSGKSTLLRAVMGLLGPSGMVTRGDILFGGQNLPDLTPGERRALNGRDLAMVFQNAGSSFCPVRTVGAQLYESAAAHGHTDRRAFLRRAEVLLERLGFDQAGSILRSYPFELSGGMQQRVGIAAAMLSEPRILLADEPTSALDVSVQKQVIEELLLIRREFGTAILLVTHNIGVIRAMADTVLVMKDGRCVEIGPAGDVLENPQEPYTRQLMAAVPRLRR